MGNQERTFLCQNVLRTSIVDVVNIIKHDKA